MSYCKFGAQTLLRLLEGLDELIAGVIENTDIECVHKTRVTSRRLRAALPLFKLCFSNGGYKLWRREIKNVTKLLAEARDLDVQIGFITKYLERLDARADKTSINLLLKDRKNRRKKIQPDIENGLEDLKASQTLTSIQKDCERMIAYRANQAFDNSQVLEKAHWHISSRLNDLLSMEPYVHIESEKIKHHQMRIYAKKLRYTMECFSPQFADKLEKEIETIKNFQDTVGEMHDSDVWLDFIPEFQKKITDAGKGRKRLESTSNDSLLDFSNYIQRRRKKHYTKFVQSWDQCMKDNFFEQLTAKTSSKLISDMQAKTKKALAKPNVKIALLSDVHANLPSLKTVIEDAEKRGADVFLNAGDSIGYGACPNEVIEFLCCKNVLSILGNYDCEVLDGKSDAKGEKRVAFNYTKKELSKPIECYLQALPHELRFEVAGKRLLIVHGSPESIEEHIYHDTPVEYLKELSKSAQSDVVIVGHSHEQFRREANGVCFINPGSVGRPGDGNPQTGYAILSFDPFRVELIRLDYNVEEAAYALRKKGLPESFAQMILKGVALDEVVKEDKAKEVITDKNCSFAIQASKRFSEDYLPESEHYQQVTANALTLFDQLTDLHKLGKRERCWLECASILHDIGLSKNAGKHHKISMKLILNSTQLPFASIDRRVIASIARYHRKTLPKLKHYNLATLDNVTVYRICILSALLRLADSLDYSHGCNVKVVGINVKGKKVTVECTSRGDPILEEQAFNKKKDLFEKVFATNVRLACKQQKL